MFYYLAEIWHLIGFDLVTAMNLACVLIVLASAAGAFLLGRLYFGDAGGWLTAAAYLYAPYFAVDLYVRTAWAEFAAFPFFAFSLYQFGAYAKDGRRRHLLLGAAAFAGILLSHHGAALLFAPLFWPVSSLLNAWRVNHGGLGLAGVWISARPGLCGIVWSQPVHAEIRPGRRLIQESN